jgi:hypothetical protein
MPRTRFASVLAALALAPAALAQQFTYDSGALPAQTIWTDGVIAEDLDGDGDKDIVFANGSVYGGTGVQGAQAQHLFLNNGSGVFTAAHAQLNVANFNAKMVIAEDFDSDDDLDLFFASGSTGSPPRLLLNNGSAVFTDVTTTNVPALALRSFSVVAGDPDNDGDLDVAVSDGGTFGGTASQARLLQNDGSAMFTDVTASRMPVDLYNCQDIAMFDVDGDLDIDMALSGKGGGGISGRLYVNNGAGTFTVATGLNAVGTGGTYETDYGDLDGDGDFDAAVQSISGFTEGWARNVGNSTAWTKTNFPGGISQDDNEMACFDYDNDGDLDVLVGSLGSAERMYANNGTGTFTHMPGVVQSQSDSTLDLVIADLDGDDDYDIVTAQGESGVFTNKVYDNGGSKDTLAPVFVQVETPGAVGGSTTQFRARIKDQVSEDGHVSAMLAYSYTTVGAGSGSGDAFHMGGGMFSAMIPTAGASQVSLTWTATDCVGNVSMNGPIVVGTASVWTDIGCGLAGVSGIPSLTGTGTLLTGSAGSLNLSNAAPLAANMLFVSLSSSPVPFKGGSLCAFPFLLGLPLGTDGSGGLVLPWASWPAGLSGASLYFQYAIDDAAGPSGASLSNALRGDVP